MFYFRLNQIFISGILLILFVWSYRWYFAVISMSGVFAVTFSVIFAYVADITQEHERSTAYGLVSRGTWLMILFLCCNQPNVCARATPDIGFLLFCRLWFPFWPCNEMKALIASMQYFPCDQHSWLIFIFPTGVGHFCSQSGNKPSDRCVPVSDVWRYIGGDPCHGHCPARHLFYPGSGSWIPAWEDETGLLGSPHLLGAGRPLCSESLMSMQVQSWGCNDPCLSHDKVVGTWWVVWF